MSDKIKYLKELDEQVGKLNKSLDIICVGGFILEQYGLKSTLDVDAFFTTTEDIYNIIEKIGEKYNINAPNGELWLNNNVMNLNKTPDTAFCKKMNMFNNINVFTTDLDYVLGMKLISMRNKDIIDIAAIINYEKIQTPKELKKRLLKYNFDDLDESLILEAFGEAYGIAWLEKYYKENY